MGYVDSKLYNSVPRIGLDPHTNLGPLPLQSNMEPKYSLRFQISNTLSNHLDH